MTSSPSSAPQVRWLLGLTGAALLAAEYVYWRGLPFDALRFGALCTVVLLLTLWERRGALRLESGPAATVVGAFLIGLVLAKSFARPGVLFASVSPLLSGLGMALLASGFRGLKQYGKQFAILLLLLAPFLLRMLVFDLAGFDVSPWTARAATGIVHLFGWPCTTQDVYVATPGGMVAVFEGCSGIRSMFFLMGLSIFFLVFFPPPGRLLALIAVPVAVGVAFAVNSVRVALLIVLVSESRHEAFEYWHLGRGALLFESASVMSFVLLYRFVFLNWKTRPPAPMESRPHAALE